MRVVSLVPGATETVFALGRGSCLVGVSHECDFPPEAKMLPVVTHPRVAAAGASYEIDQQVRAAVAAGEPLYDIDAELLRALSPELVLAQDRCEVCALPAHTVEQLVQRLGFPVTVVRLHAHDLESLLADIQRIARALRCASQGEELAGKMRAEIAAVARTVQRARYRPRVLCLEWLDPPMVAGNWMPALVECAGGQAVLSRAGEESRSTSWSSIAQAGPEVVVLMPCGFTMERTMAEVERLRSHAEWPSLPAVRHGRVYVVDGNAYFNRPGPRIVDSLRILAGLVQPGLCARWLPPGTWERIEP
ncbi:MAG: cobalamin-binding protein [Candidatus Binatia bacterium]|nr:MAG: cobalamin-binding protein [Candidatus Binatia bacterium]